MRTAATAKTQRMSNRKYGCLGAWALLLCLFATQAAAQEQAASPRKKLSFIARLDSARQARIAAGKGLFTPFLAPSYTPETGFLLSGGGLYTFTTDRADSTLLRSSIPFAFGISSTGARQASLFTTIFFPRNRYRLLGELWYKDMPYHYWGVGYEAGRGSEQSDSTTLYQRNWLRLYNKLLRRFTDNFYSGPILDLARTKATELNPLMQIDAAVVSDGSEIRNSGIGWVFQYDSRDVVVNAYEGLFLDLSTIWYTGLLGGEWRYRTLDIDYRQYKRLGEKRRVLAWQARTRHAFGNVPWPELSLVGSPVDLRGYYWGRYRDKSMLLGLVEYRHMFQRRSLNRKGNYDSPFGFVAWAGVGTLGGSPSDLFRDYIPNAGLGFRVETEPRMNIRIDYGLGLNTSQFYVSFNEAF